jgi:hypothetical protein
MRLNNSDIINYLDEIDNHLKTSNRIQFEYNLLWASQFENKPAIYAIFKSDVLVYIGETASLKKRMSDIRRTYNHTFRKHLGINLFNVKPNNKGVFSEENEIALSSYFEENIKVTFYYINFGRSEAESYIIHKNKGDNSDLLFNKIGKRDLKVIEALKSK